MTLPGEDGYAGPAELLVGEDVIEVTVRLSGRVDPISGSYTWYGRVAASAEVAALIAAGTRLVVLRTPFASVDTMLADVDPWGRPRVSGAGSPPFPVSHDPREDD